MQQACVQVVSHVLYAHRKSDGTELMLKWLTEEGIPGWCDHEAMDMLSATDKWWIQLLIYAGISALAVLLLVTIFYPLVSKRSKASNAHIHQKQLEFSNVEILPYQCIALALDFGDKDNIIISNAMKYIRPETELLLIHIVESAGAKILGENIDDVESAEDRMQLALYQQQLAARGIKARFQLGYRNRIKEIVRICKAEKADLLILGAHGHKGLFDFVYGQTIESVRHQLEIPILIVK